MKGFYHYNGASRGRLRKAETSTCRVELRLRPTSDVCSCFPKARVPGRERRQERVRMLGSAMPRSALRLASLSKTPRPASLPRPLRFRSPPAASSYSTNANAATSSRTIMAAVAASVGLAAAAFATTYNNKSVSSAAPPALVHQPQAVVYHDSQLTCAGFCSPLRRLPVRSAQHPNRSPQRSIAPPLS